MFNAVKAGGRNLNALIDAWIADFEEHTDQAIVRLLQLIVSACGCDGELNVNMIRTMDFKNIIARLAEDFDEETGDYPLVMVGPQWKKFRSNFADFIMLFAIKCKSGIIFNVDLMDDLIKLLTGLADSNVRAFRHTATFAAMKLSSAIVDIIVEQIELKTKNALQIETEKAKLAQMAASNERLELLHAAKAELDTKIGDLCAMIQYMFKSVFVHRYRDIVADIRCICVAELGNWMRVYPAYFLEDSYLKYIGWTLFDRVPEVRQRCLSALLPLYERADLVARLELFTNKFKERLVSMVMDEEPEVAIHACRLMIGIYRAFPPLLELRDCVPIYELVYSTNHTLAAVAGEFLITKVFPNTAGATPMVMTEQSTSAIQPVVDNRQLLADLVAFYTEGEVHNHAAYLVDALIDVAPMLRDWRTMVNMLLVDDSDHYDNELIEIMCAAIKQTATAEPPAGRIHSAATHHGGRRGGGAAATVGANPTTTATTATLGAGVSGASAKDARLLHEERLRISEVFIPALPKLLSRFIADQSKIANLTTIPLFFVLEMYQAARLEQDLVALMGCLERCVEQHVDDEVLKNVAAIVHYFSAEGGGNVAVAQFTEALRHRIVDGVVVQLQRGMERFLEVGGGLEDEDDGGDGERLLDEEDEAALLASYRKMAAFSAVMDLRSDVWDLTHQLLSEARRFRSADLAEKAVLLLAETLAWELKRLLAEPQPALFVAAAAGGVGGNEMLQRLRKRSTQFFECVHIILREGAAGVENAYLCLCDLLILLNPRLVDEYAAQFGAEVGELLRSLQFPLGEDLRSRITAFVVDNVFVQEEDENFQKLDQHLQLQLMGKRRNILTQYCKLIMHGVLHISNAAHVLKYYTKFYNDFGDLLKTLLQRCREADKLQLARAIAHSLIGAYRDEKALRGGDGYVDPNSEEFGAIRELAKKFAMSFGQDHVRNRDALALIHREGILYALREEAESAKQRGGGGARKVATTGAYPSNLSFLEVLIDFSAKLVRQDKAALLRYLDKHSPVRASEPTLADDPLWQPLLLYRSSLAVAVTGATSVANKHQQQQQQHQNNDAASVVTNHSN